MAHPSAEVAVPRQPVLSWRGLSLRQQRGIPAVTDGRDHVLTCSGRSALVLALRQLGIGPGDRVLLPNYYCPTMVAPVERVGAEPVFYPIRPDRTPDLGWLERHEDKRIRALLAAHFFGLPLDFALARGFCDRQGIGLIEDCAHAFFGQCGERAVGSTGDLSIASIPKFFPSIEGGVLVAGRRALEAPRAALPRPGARANLSLAWSQFQLATESGRLPGLNWLGRSITAIRLFARRPKTQGRDAEAAAEPAEVTRENALTDPLLAPRTLSAPDRWSMIHSDRRRIIANRRRNYARYAELLPRTVAGWPLCPDLPAGAVPYVFPLFLDDPEPAYGELRRRRLPAFRWDRYWPGAIGDADDTARRWGHHVIQLSCHQDLTLEDLEKIAAAVRSPL